MRKKLGRLLVQLVLATCLVAHDIQEKQSLILDLIDSGFQTTHIINLVLCSDGLKILKAFSYTQNKLLTLHKPDDNIEDWLIADGPQTFLLDRDCSESELFLEQANSMELFRPPYSWIIINCDSKASNKTDDNTSLSLVFENMDSYFIDFLSGFNLMVDNSVIIASKQTTETYRLYSVYKIELNGELKTEELGEWRLKTGILWRSKLVPAVRRKDLEGLVVKVSIVLTDPSSKEHIEEIVVDKHIDTISKAAFPQVINALLLLNATQDYTVVDNWGYATNGSWNGMVGQIQRGEAEIAGSSLYVTADRFGILEYVHVITPTRATFFFLSPSLSTSNNIFTLPFDGELWASSVAMFAVYSTVLYFAIKYLKKTSNIGKKSENNKELNDSWSDIVIFNFAAISQQGSNEEPKSVSGRIIAILLLMANMFLYVAYSACIVVLLQSSDRSISSLEDLLNSPLKCGAADIVYVRHYFEISSDTTRRQLYLKKIIPEGKDKSHYFNAEQGIKLVKDGMFAFFVEENIGYLIIQRLFDEAERSRLQTLKERFINTFDPWVAVKKNSPYSEMLKISFKRLQEYGIQSREYARFYIKKKASVPGGVNFGSVGIIDCYPAFMILFYGMIISIALLVIEKMYVKRQQILSKKNIGLHIAITEYLD